MPDSDRQYSKGRLRRHQLDPDPLVQFNRWYAQACEANVAYAQAMGLATVSRAGTPRLRTVFLKQADAQGFVFYTNYCSAKAEDIDHCASVSLMFLWKPLERQVTVAGRAHKIPRADSAAYFATRPRASQLGALVSPQSRVIPSREYLDARFREADAAHGESPIACPEHWGGYRVTPRVLEFWQGRPGRLNDRFLYTFNDNHTWVLQRLAP